MNIKPIYLTYTWTFFFFFHSSGYAQLPGVGNLNLPATPQFKPLAPISVLSNNGNQINESTMRIMNEVDHFKSREDRRLLVEECLRDFNEENERSKVPVSGVYRIDLGYKTALNELETMETLPDSMFSITDAVYKVENAFFDQKLPYDRFKALIQFRAGLCKNLLRKEKLDSTDNLSKNYVIQKLFTDTLIYNNSATRQRRKIPPLKYDFEDYKGEEHWENMFVSKLLLTGRGQCHSMPLMYLMVAEALGASAYLSLAPEHSYIQFPGPSGRNFNFETTSGILVSNSWLMQSGFINTAAIKQGTYMNTLDRKRLLAYMIMDLTLGYLHKYGFDSFVAESIKKVKRMDPDNLNMLLLESNLLTQQTMTMIKNAGSPPPDKLPQYPTLYTQYKKMLASYDKVDDLGFQAMPKEAYQAWLKSVNKEREKQLNGELKRSLHLQLNNKSIKLTPKN
ncbi:hypothetical protein [Chitinophaga vietnamensis]|uniref:hypothetical protein n=1 Tax=Chitinophaga vietnamensis TaxID=2593957 RepID=UPI0011778639|nr:hypothetical protein [Chitinophaga vietnamensis]